MTLPALYLVFGLVLLVWSADRFVDGSAATARHFGMPPLLIGMVIVGFGTSAPEMFVSGLAAMRGNSGLALGNAYGSNIANITVILGIAALVAPITVHSQVLRKELPILTAVTGLAVVLVLDGDVSRLDGWVLLGVFGGLMGWTILQGLRHRADALGGQTEQELEAHPMTMGRGLFWMLLGLVLLIASSQLLVTGAVEIAQAFGVSDLLIGLTIVAVGTSLPELASSVMAARKGEHDIALGNVLGSNLFNTLAVVGIAAAIHPMDVPPEVISRDMGLMGVLTVSLFAIGWGFKGPGRVNRLEAVLLLSVYVGYIVYLTAGATGQG